MINLISYNIMKKSILVLFFLGFACGIQLFAQGVEGRYAHARDLNDNDIEVSQIVLSLNGTVYDGNWETAMATGENELITPLQNLVVDEQDLTISFVLGGQTHTGTFVSDGAGGYSILLDGLDMYARQDW
jgi:hypothetical protein